MKKICTLTIVLLSVLLVSCSPAREEAEETTEGLKADFAESKNKVEVRQELKKIGLAILQYRVDNKFIPQTDSANELVNILLEFEYLEPDANAADPWGEQYSYIPYNNTEFELASTKGFYFDTSELKVKKR